MTDSSIFDGMDKPRRKRRKRKPPKQTVLWTVYHTILAIELLIIMLVNKTLIYSLRNQSILASKYLYHALRMQIRLEPQLRHHARVQRPQEQEAH